MRRTVWLTWLSWVVMAVLWGGMNQAAWFERGTHDGGAADSNQTPECPAEGDADDGSTDDECVTDIDELGNGDPNDSCPVGVSGSGGDSHPQNNHLEQAIECIESNPSLEYDYRYDSYGVPFGLDILYTDGRELNAICYREKRLAIQSVSVGLYRDTHMARIAKLPADLTFGAGNEIVIELNGVPHVFDTGRGGPNAFNLNNAIYFALSRGGYAIYDTGDFWTIHTDPEGAAVNEARFSSNDGAVQFNAVSIEPINDANYPWCFPPASSAIERPSEEGAGASEIGSR